jgi:hypothetical protein
MHIRSKVLACVLTAGIAAGGLIAGPAHAAAPTMNIQILQDADFNAEHGVTSGKGTKTDPYVFSGLELNALQISDTSKYFEIKKTHIAGPLVLNWNGDRAKVHYNSIGQLHVNQNVVRTGGPTSGSIVHNRIGKVNQLRHWDGLFAYNTVGAKNKLAEQGVNFDGFNGAKFQHNTIYGFMDARLHGHHHSSSFGGESHMHTGHHHMAQDHTQRYHQVSVMYNKITTTHPYALAYLDTGHAGNDRTATSETNEALNGKHAHHTKVKFANNKLSGAGILVDVFNSNDENHVRTYNGRLDILKNTISLAKDAFFSGKQLNGIEVRNATDVHTQVQGNRITGWKPNGFLSFLERWDTNAGILLQNVDKAHIYLVDNSVANRHFGIRSQNFTVTVSWVIDNLKTSNVKERVSSQNVPRRAYGA